MNVRPAITAALTTAAAVAAAFALAACSPDADATPTPTPTAGPTSAPTDGPTTAPTPPTGEVTIRAIVEGAVLESTANALRTQFPTWAQFDDGQIEEILNAGCDALDREGNPIAGADAIAGYGLEAPEAAFGLYAAISNYCPEYTQFVTG